MNSLADPGVAELLERFHREADAQMPELRKRVAAMGKNEQTPEHWSHELWDFYLPVSREQGQFLYQTVRAVRPERVAES